MALSESGQFLGTRAAIIKGQQKCPHCSPKKGKLECVAEDSKSHFTKNIRWFVKDESTGILKGL